jgi:uncharacterized protein YbjT (DUF2867 family)
MSDKKVLVVFGATGTQGGSVIKAILADPKTAEAYSIRAITRDPSKPAAQKLTAAGVEVITVSPTFYVYSLDNLLIRSTQG